MAAENFNQEEALKRFGQRYDEEGNLIGTAEAPLGTAGNAAETAAGMVTDADINAMAGFRGNEPTARMPESAAVQTAANGGGTAGNAAGTMVGAGGYNYKADPLATGWNAQSAAPQKTNGGAAVQTAANVAENAAGAAAAQGAAGTVAGAGKSAVEKAIEKQGEQVAAEIKAKQAQARWEPTKENLMRSGLNAADYIRKAREAGAKIDPLDVYMGFYAKDPTKTWAENEADEKKAKAQANMAAIGNALMHVGNFVGGMVGGQSAKLEDPVQFTQRQKALKERTDALRLAAWQNSYNTYKDKLAAERAQAAAELAAKRQAQQENYQNTLAAIAAGKAAADKGAKEKAADLNEKKLEHTIEKDKQQLEINKQNAESRRVSAQAATIRAAKTGSGGSGSRGGSGKGKWLGADGVYYKNIQDAVATFPAGYEPKAYGGKVSAAAMNASYVKYHNENTHNKTNNGGSKGKAPWRK